MTKVKKIPEDLKTLEEKKARHEPPPPKYQPNLTPLIDVLFLLLLFFLLGTKMRRDEGLIPAALPNIGTIGSTTNVEGKVEISIFPSGVDGESAQYAIKDTHGGVRDANDLYKKLCILERTLGADAQVVIAPGIGTRWEFVVEAFNQAYRAKFNNIAFAAAK